MILLGKASQNTTNPHLKNSYRPSGLIKAKAGTIQGRNHGLPMGSPWSPNLSTTSRQSGPPTQPPLPLCLWVGLLRPPAARGAPCARGGTGTLVFDSIRIRGCRALPPCCLVIVSTFVASSLSAKRSVSVKAMCPRTKQQVGQARLPPSLKEDG